MTNSADKFDFRGYLQEQYPQYKIGIYSYTAGPMNVHSYNQGITFTMGKFCSVGNNLNVYLGGGHRIDWLSQFPFPAFFEDILPMDSKIYAPTKGDVIVGNDVWIGDNVTILSGVTIGDGAIIGVNSTVTKDVPAYAMVVGSPAKVIKKRFSDSIIEKLLEIRWWDLPEPKLRELIPLLCNDDIESLLISI